MKIEYSALANRDLERVWAEVYEASKDMEVAVRYIDGLMNRVAEKKEFPKSASPLYYEGSFTGFYFVIFKAYMVFYKVQPDRIVVSRIVYSKSDYMRSIFRHLDQ